MKKKLSAVLLALAASMPMTAQNLVKGNYGYLYCHMSNKGEWTAYAISRDAYITRLHNGNGYIMVTTDMCNRKRHKKTQNSTKKKKKQEKKREKKKKKKKKKGGKPHH